MKPAARADFCAGSKGGSMDRREIKTAALCIIAGFLVLTSFAVVYADCLLGRIISGAAKKHPFVRAGCPCACFAAHSHARTYPRRPSLFPPAHPCREILLTYAFRSMIRGSDAEYSYQSDELRIAVNKVERKASRIMSPISGCATSTASGRPSPAASTGVNGSTQKKSRRTTTPYWP